MAKRKDGYITNGRTYEHRDSWEQVSGKIPTGAVIHHVNNDKSDNRLDNLQFIENNGKHRRENHSGVPVDYMPAFTDREMEFVREHLPLDVILKQKRPG